MPTNVISSSSTSVANYLNLLLKNGLINREDLGKLKAKYQTAEELYQALDLVGAFKEDELAKLYAQSVGLPYIKLESVDKKAFEMVGKDLAMQFSLIPFSIDEKNKKLQVAISDPGKVRLLDESAVKELETKLGYKIEFFVTSKESLEKIVEGGIPLVTEDGPVDDAGRDFVFDPETVEVDAFRKIPFEIAEKYKIIIFRQSGDKVYDLAAENPDDPKLQKILDFVKKKSDITIRIFRVDESVIGKALKKYQALEAGVPEKSFTAPEVVGSQGLTQEQISQPENDLEKFLGKSRITTADLKTYAASSQIPQFVGAVLFLASKERASDVHIEPFEKVIRVRYRIDGELGEVILIPAGMISSIVARIKILAKLKLDEQRVPQDGRFDIKVGREIIDIRVSTLPTVFGEKVELRLLSKSRKLEKLEDLGMDGISFDRLIEAISKPYGVILSTGPTGSGKTTTLYSVLNRLNRPEVNIVTLEDPVEYELAGINQVQVKPQIGFGFANGLRSVLRQDPNIIMVGEIRDHETAELVTHAALTGHLVLTTLHTNNAAGALARLFNLGVEPFLLTSSTNAVIGQRLVRRICQNCKVEIPAPQSLLFEIKKILQNVNLNHPIKFYKGKGCDQCKDGFKGRVGIFEVLTITPQIEDLVLEKKPASDIFAQAVKDGMITMKQDGIIKAVRGLTTIEEVMRVTSQI